MAVRFPGIMHARQILKRLSWSTNQAASMPSSAEVPRGHFAVYIGETEKRRFVVPLSLLSQPSFQELLSKAEEEFGFDHPMGGLTIHCTEDVFLHLANGL